MVLHDSEKNREEATVVGDRALLREQEKTYQVFNPLVVVLLWPSGGQPVDVELPKLHLKADQADVDEAQGIVRFFGNVTATGEDFEVTTDGVVYAVNERTLTSDKPVRMQRDKVDKAGNRTPALVVTGLGLNADLGLQNMSVLKDAMAHVYDVSEDFLATGLEKPASTGAGREVVITSDGPLLYEHLARRVTFSDNVAAVSDQKKLTSQKLTISLGTSDAGKRMEVTDIVATGKAQLFYQDQVARGDRLEWHNVTQTGVLTGSPAVLVTSQFELTGKELTFYRMNDRFHSEGPGSLLWKSGAKGAGVADEADAGRGAAETPWDIGPLRLSGGAPVHVTWTDSMTYHVAAHVATFKGQVVARQQESALECNELVLNFEPTAGAIQKVQAAGAVDVRDAQSPGGRNLGSDRLVWDATRDKVELVAREGETVNVESGGRSVASSHVVVDNSGQTMDCPAEGRLTVKPTPAKSGRAAQSAPVVVDWQKEMHFAQRPSPVALFAGSATARQGDQQITGETLRAEFDEKMSPLRISARGGAAIEVRSAEKAAAETPGGAPAGGAAPGVVPALTGGRWRLTSEQFDISVPDDAVTCPLPGVLTVFTGDRPAGTITWQKTMRLDTANNAAVFEGDVNGEFSGAVLKSQKLTVEFDKARKIRHVFADGSVFFSRQEQGAWQLESKSGEAVFAAENELQQVIARGDVRVRDEQRLLSAQLLQLFFGRPEIGTQPALDRVVAQDTVRVNYLQGPPTEAGGDRLEWDRKANIYVLTGDPGAYLRRGALKVMNDKVLVDRDTGRMTLPPGARPVRTVVGPEQ